METEHPGHRLRRIREALGLSLRAAARQLHVKHPALKAWEDEEQIPTAPYRDAIEVWTKGDIKTADWPLSAREHEIVENASKVREAVPLAPLSSTKLSAAELRVANDPTGTED